VDAHEDTAQKSFNEHFTPWIKNQEANCTIHFYKFRRYKKEEAVYIRYIHYFTPFELPINLVDLNNTYKLKITEEQLDAYDNDPKGRVELLNLFYIKYLSYNLFGYSFL